MILGPASALAFPSLSIYTGNSLIKALLSYANHLSHKEYCSHTHLCKGHAVGLILHTTHDRWRRIQTWEFHSIWIDRRLKKKKEKKFMCVMAFITKSHTGSWQEETLIKKWQMEGVILPEEGLLLRGEGGAKVKSGWIGGLLLWGGEPNAGKCWRFSSPICTSGSGEWKCKYYGPQFQNMRYIKGVIFRYTYIYPASCSPQSQFASLCVSHLSPSSASGVFFSPSHLKGLKDDLFYLRNLYSKTLKTSFKCSNLQTCPEFPGTGLVVAVLAHRCWTRTWVADEPDSDAGGGSPARRKGG